jgi:tetratricopeptide (TPR) repeat protein
MGSPHLTREDIARLAAGDITSMREEARSHLASCPECRDAVRESELWLATWTSQPEAFADEANARRATRSFLRDLSAGAPAGSRWRRWALTGSALVAAVLAFLIWKPNDDRLPFSIAPVTTAIEETALTSRVLIPGAENADLKERDAFRSGVAQPSPETDAALHRLVEAYLDGSGDEDVAATLVAGYLATGQLGSARDFVKDARARYPDDGRLLVLDGLVAYLEGRTNEAEDLLRSALARDPRDSVAMVNLAQLLSDTGRRDEAVSLARSVRDDARSAVLVARADAILSGAPPRS